MAIGDYALTQYLHRKSRLLFGKAEELHASTSGWLSYIPGSFPHYTRHTVDHSERIISQISNLIFKDDDCRKPVLQISGIEAYILVAGALLHDSCMVVADEEKIKILGSEDWKDWISLPEREQRLDAIRDIRNSGGDSISSTFVADLQLRFLIAEFVRARHHIRGGQFLSHNQSALGRFALDELLLQNSRLQVALSVFVHWAARRGVPVCFSRK